MSVKNTIKEILKKPSIRIIITILLLFVTINAGLAVFNNDEMKITEAEPAASQVKIVNIDLDAGNEATIKTVGTVKADSQIDVIATTRGTVKNIFFKVGDKVKLKQLMATLYDSTTLTGLNNAYTNLSNAQNGLSSSKRLTDATISQTKIGIEQAKIGLANAEKAITSAQIGLDTALNNKKNAQILRKKNNQAIKDQALVSFNSYQNTIFTALDKVKLLLNIDNTNLPENSNTSDPALGAKDPKTLTSAKSAYKKTKNAYNELLLLSPDADTIVKDMNQAVSALGLTEQMLSKTIIVMDKTVSGSSYSETDITLEKNTLSAMRASTISSQTVANNTLNQLQNIDLITTQELDNLNSAVAAAKNQLSIAKIAYDNAKTGLKTREQNLLNSQAAQDQQLVSSQSAVNNARGQLNLSRALASDLNIKAPIEGVVTQKFVELGAEVSPGQKILQISQTENLKIEVSLPSEDIYRVKLGQSVTLGDNLVGTISLIDPAADPITKKVRLEILFDNQNKELIQGTFINVIIPVEKLDKSNPGAVFIPLRALSITQTESFVFLAEDSRAKKNPVVTGKTEGALIEILEGLHNGDKLIVEGNKNLNDGDLIEILK